MEPIFLGISSRKDHERQPVRTACGNAGKVPKNPLLRELEELGHFSRSSSSLEQDDEYDKDDFVKMTTICSELNGAMVDENGIIKKEPL